MNTFSTDYLRQEIDFMALPQQDEGLGVAEFFWRELPKGPIDDYLNVQFNIEDVKVPLYKREGRVWMSLTRMEVQSAYVPIYRALHHHTVACGGLGMGYVPLRMAQLAAYGEQAIQIDVYEENADCIRLFEKVHGHRPEMEDIRIIHGDMRKLCVDKEYDYVYNDIYESILPQAAMEDIEYFWERNLISEYRYWGQELAVYLASHDDELIGAAKRANIITFEDIEFFREYSQSEDSHLRPPSVCEDFCQEIVEEHCRVMGEW